MARRRQETANFRPLLARASRLLEHGNLAAAERAARKVLRQFPGQADALQLLGILALQKRDCAAAVRIFKRLTTEYPAATQFHLNYGIVLQKCGEAGRAEEAYHRAIELDPATAITHYNLGLLLQEQGRLESAEAAYSRAVRLDPSYAAAHVNLGAVLFRQDNLPAAEAEFRRALAITPDDPEVHYDLARLLEAEGRVDEAEQALRNALDLQPLYFKALLHLSALLERDGRVVQAEEVARRAMAVKPDSIEALAQYARCHHFQLGEPEIERLKLSLLENSLEEKEKTLLLTGLAKAWDEVGEYDRAFDCYRRLNEDRKAQSEEPFECIEFQERIERVMQVYGNPVTVGEPAPVSPVPIFVVGMSRSGKSLVESLLAQAPEVHAAGECPYWHEAVEEVVEREGMEGKFPFYAGQLTGCHFREIGEIYMSRIRALSPRSRFIVNTLPGYFVYVGLMLQCLPGVKIIQCRRQALDNALFVYFRQYRSGHEYSYDLRDLAVYLKGCRELIAHWQCLYRDAVLTVDYEDLVQRPRNVARDLYGFCGLNKDPASIHADFTPAEIGHWVHYEQRLQPLVRALEKKAAPLSPGAAPVTN